jgi:hypothetical protein
MVTSNKQLASDSALLAGVKKHIATLSTVTVAGQSYTPTEVVATLQPLVDTGTAAATSKVTWQDSVKAAATAQAEAKAFVAQLRLAIYVLFGNSASILSDFGMVPRKVRTTDPLAQVVAAERRRATRKARGTMGKVEKASIKGSVPATISIAVPGAELAPSAALPTPPKP